VRFPPPLVHVAGIAVGWLLHPWRPLPVTGLPPTPVVLLVILRAVIAREER
jgi:hypothetical protein